MSSAGHNRFGCMSIIVMFFFIAIIAKSLEFIFNNLFSSFVLISLIIYMLYFISTFLPSKRENIIKNETNWPEVHDYIKNMQACSTIEEKIDYLSKNKTEYNNKRLLELKQELEFKNYNNK